MNVVYQVHTIYIYILLVNILRFYGWVIQLHGNG